MYRNNKPLIINTTGHAPIINIVFRMALGYIKEVIWDNSCYDCIKECYKDIQVMFENNTLASTDSVKL